MELLSWGANGDGQLGHGHKRENEITRPTKVPGSDCLQIGEIKQIVGGGAHTILLLGNGNLYVCGRNNRGQLGSSDAKTLLTLQPIIFPKLKIKLVACGWEHNLAITEDGELFAWGANAFGQLGVSSKMVPFSATPLQVNVNQGDGCVSSVSAGIRHSVACTVTGTIYTWGSGKKGQLGIILANGHPPKEMETPIAVPLASGARAIKVVCGAYFTTVLTDDGKLLAWGSNDRGQLTQDPELCRTVLAPHLIVGETFGGVLIKELHSGWTHTLAITVNDDTFSWGRNDYGQLGRMTTNKAYDWIPGLVEQLKHVQQVFVGSEHNVAVMSTSSGQALYTWGWNEHGICGNGSEENVMFPTEIKTIDSTHQFTLLSGGCGHNFAITASES